MESNKRIKILDVPIDMVNQSEALTIFEEIMGSSECSLVVTPNSEIIMNASKDKELKKIIETADLIIPDGIGLVYASKIMGLPLYERVTGIDFLEDILKYLEKTGQSIYLLGSKPGNESSVSIAELAANKMIGKYKGLKIAGTHHGYFQESEEADIIQVINQSGADFLCVALGSPKQEKFIYKYIKQLNVKCAIGVGGSLDVWAGNVKRAPEFYRNNGLEWLYRLVQQPSRYKRMAALPLFIIKVFVNRLKGIN